MTNNNPSEEVRRNVLAAALNIYENRVYDPEYKNSLRPRLEAVMSHLLQTSNFEQEVDEHLRGIGIFPTAFEHEENRKVELRRLLAATFYAANGDKPVWMFQDVHLHGLAASVQVAPGDTLVEINGQPVAPPVKPTILAHGVSRMTVETRKGSKTLEVNPELLNARPANGIKYWLLHHDPHNYAQSSILPGGIGYVRIAEFPGLIGVHVAHQIDKAFARVSRCERLIVDIRGNPGGGTANLRLMTHLTPERIPVGYSLTRPRAESGYRREELPQFTRIPASRLLLPFAVWKFRKLDKSIVVATEGRKRKPYDGRIVMLVNEHTISGAEIVAGFASDHGLAKLAGTRTRGTMLGFYRFFVGHGYFLTVPVSNYVTWEGKTFEHSGVVPDVEVPFDPDVAKEGRDSQLEAAVALILPK